MSLKFHSGKRSLISICSVVFRCHSHDHGAVGIFSGSSMITHSIDTETPLFRGRIDYIASRTHAERVDSPPVFRFCRQLVCSRRKIRMLFRTILGQIDPFLKVFDTDAHRKGFCFQKYSCLFQHRKGISCAVSQSQYNHFRRNQGFFPLLFDPDFLHSAVPGADSGQLCVKPAFSAGILYGFPHPAYHINQDVRSDMWFILIQDLLRCTMRHKDLQHFPVSSCRIFHQSVQFPVGKSPCTALAKLNICPCIQHSGLPERLHCFFSFFHRRPALNQNRTVSVFCKQIRTEQSGRTTSYYYRPVFHLRRFPARRKLIRCFFFFGYILKFSAGQNRFFLLHFCQLHINRVYIINFRFFSGINRTLPDFNGLDLFSGHAKSTLDLSFQLLFCMSGFNFQLSNP